MLTNGHGEDPTVGLQDGDMPKEGNMAWLLNHMPQLLRSQEAKRVHPVCLQHNMLAGDANRGKALQWWLGVVEGSQELDGVLQEVETRWGRGTASVWRRKAQAAGGGAWACSQGCPYGGASDGRLSAPPGLDFASDTEDEEDRYTIGKGSFTGYDDYSPGDEDDDAGAAAQELAVGGEAEDAFQGADTPGPELGQRFLALKMAMSLVGSSGQASGDAARGDGTGEADPWPGGKCGSYRPTRSDFLKQGIELATSAFFPEQSRRAGQAKNVSSVARAIDRVVKSSSLTEDQLKFLDDELGRMMDTRSIMHAACHMAADAERCVCVCVCVCVCGWGFAVGPCSIPAPCCSRRVPCVGCHATAACVRRKSTMFSACCSPIRACPHKQVQLPGHLHHE
jgi:hypothetical protein